VPIIDREIGELFLKNADDPIRTHVMALVHEWWANCRVPTPSWPSVTCRHW
jgi:hypothetical protein